MAFVGYNPKTDYRKNTLNLILYRSPTSTGSFEEELRDADIDFFHHRRKHFYPELKELGKSLKRPMVAIVNMHGVSFKYLHTHDIDFKLEGLLEDYDTVHRVLGLFVGNQKIAFIHRLKYHGEFANSAKIYLNLSQ